MNRINIKRRLILILIAFVISFATLISLTGAWLSKNHTLNGNITIGNITQGIDIEFNNGVDAPIDGAVYYQDLAIVTDATNGNTSTNNIENMNVTLVFSPDVACYFRIKICTEYYITRVYNNIDKTTSEVVSQEGISGRFPYNIVNFSTDWTIDYATGYLYYKELIPAGEVTTISFITGGKQYGTTTNRIFTETCIGYVDFILDSVQANRYEEVWGFNPFV